jgi:hypothetical protein
MRFRNITNKPLLTIGLVFFVGYLTNIFFGKLSLLLGAPQPVHLGDVPEFILLLLSVIFLVILTVSNSDAK